MKTLEEIKEEYAKDNGYIDWGELENCGVSNSDINEIAERYAKERVNDVLDKAAEEAQGAIECYPSEQEEIKKSILKLKIHSK